MKRGVEYIESEKISKEDFKKSVPIELLPTKKLSYAFVAILIVVLGYNFAHFPLNQFLNMGSLDEELVFEIGWPQPFFVLNFFNPDTLPLRFGGLLLDMALYLLIAYCIDVALNVFLHSTTVESLTGKKDLLEAKPKLVR